MREVEAASIISMVVRVSISRIVVVVAPVPAASSGSSSG
jgi:hypothetical protein